MNVSAWLRRIVAAWYHLWAMAYHYRGNVTGKLSEYQHAEANLSQALLWNPNRAAFYLERGILRWRELNRPQDAVKDLTLALTLDPALHEARFNRGVAYQQMQAYDLARADFRAYLSAVAASPWREYAARYLAELESATRR